APRPSRPAWGRPPSARRGAVAGSVGPGRRVSAGRLGTGAASASWVACRGLWRPETRLAWSGEPLPPSRGHQTCTWWPWRRCTGGLSRRDTTPVEIVEQSADELVRRASADDIECARLDDSPVPHHGDPVADVHGLTRLVGHVERRHTTLLEQSVDEGEQLALEAHVQVRERLVEEHGLRIEDQRPRDRDPLAFTAGEVGRTTVFFPGETYPPSHIRNPRLANCARHSSRLESEGE